MILRFANYLMIAVFILAIIVQYNDVNPLRWMLIYGAACVICILFALKKLHWIASSVVLFISGVWALMKIPDLTVNGFQHMLDEVHMIQTGVEAAREFLGLLIIFAWVAVLAISNYREKKGKVAVPSD
ncbi:MAG: transmembrane 220 family protein [Balneolaceae bacterium]|nr:transmembrane 220 family protein [Balneolaceae bacterium]